MELGLYFLCLLVGAVLGWSVSSAIVYIKDTDMIVHGVIINGKIYDLVKRSEEGWEHD